MNDHLTAADIDRLVEGGFTTAQVKPVLRHLLSGCAECGQRIQPLLQLLPGSDTVVKRPCKESDYDEPIARALSAALSRRPEWRKEDKALVARGLELIRAKPSGVLGLTDEEAEEIQGWPMVEVLLTLSFDERYRNPREMLSLASFAKIAADNLDPRELDPLLIADYQARAWAELGNAYRVNDDLKRADASIDEAIDRLQLGSGNLLLWARVLDLRASLLNDQRRIPDACQLLDSVYQIYRKVGDDHLAGRALISKGLYLNYEGNPHSAIDVLRDGLCLLDVDRDHQLASSASQVFLEVMVQCGQFHEAAEMLLESGLRLRLADQPLNLVTLRWVEGQIFAGLGKSERAETALLEARAGFRSHQKEYKAALVGLDLASVWLDRGKKAEVGELAKDMLATFERLGIQREAVRALGYLHQACERQRITPRTVGSVRRFLDRLEREPHLRFEAL